jgi:hypothetical protein
MPTASSTARLKPAASAPRAPRTAERLTAEQRERLVQSALIESFARIGRRRF